MSDQEKLNDLRANIATEIFRLNAIGDTLREIAIDLTRVNGEFIQTKGRLRALALAPDLVEQCERDHPKGETHVKHA